MTPLTLASASPRRAHLLQSAGFRTVIRPIDVDESSPDREHPARSLALRKARAALHILNAEHGLPPFGLTADTLVHLPDQPPLGKPTDRHDAARMLRALAGNTHLVTTAVTLFSLPEQRILDTLDVTTAVHFLPLSDALIDAYLDTDEPWDKAGAYAIQGLGASFVRAIEGSWSNVVGLPLAEVVSTLRTAGAFRLAPWEPTPPDP